MEKRDVSKGKKILAIASVAVVLLLAVMLTAVISHWLTSFSEDGFRDYLQSFGTLGWLVLLVIQILQVFIALIPGEVVETAAGYAFGPWLGTLVCYLGVAIASMAVFSLVRKLGVRFVSIFVSPDRINEMRFINTDKKRDFLIFILFFIPGTPKDLLTYFVGLTDIKLTRFLLLSLIARIPSVVSSTFGGHLLGEGEYYGALLLYGITGGLSLIGMLIYNLILKKKAKK